MTTLARTKWLLRVELADALRSRWMLFTAVLYVGVFGSFVWLGLRESSVLGFTGMSRVVLNLSNALVLTLPLVALVATNQSVVRARSSGFFELFLSQPVRRGDWLRSAAISRLVVLVAPIVVLLVVAFAFGMAQEWEPSLLPLVIRSLLVSVALTFAFVGIGFLVSSLANTPERATVLALLAWVTSSILHDFALIGALLNWRISPKIVFAIAASNPVEAARVAILSGVDPELSVLGPVGFWLANNLGSTIALIIGIGWPLVVGALCLGLSARRLSHMDLVG